MQKQTTKILSILFFIILLISFVSSASRIINFSNYDWKVKSGFDKGPGPNDWSNSDESVWIDELEQLHLKIRNIDGNWFCSSLSQSQSLGYGTYEFITIGKIDTLNENTVIGLFIYQDDEHEYDIEYSKWRNKNASHTLHYSVQPYWIDPKTNSKGFSSNLDNGETINQIIWTPNKVGFITKQFDTIIADWEYIGEDNFIPGEESVHINFWLSKGYPPSDNNEQEIIIKEFNFYTFVEEEIDNTENEAVIDMKIDENINKDEVENIDNTEIENVEIEDKNQINEKDIDLNTQLGNNNKKTEDTNYFIETKTIQNIEIVEKKEIDINTEKFYSALFPWQKIIYNTMFNWRIISNNIDYFNILKIR